MSEITVFLGGPIQYALQNGEFSQKLKGQIENGIATMEKSGFKVLSAHRYEEFGKMDVVGKHLEVTTRDFDWMQQCDVFVALLPNDEEGTPIRTDGTCIELGWASALKRPLIVIRDLEGEHSHLVKGLNANTEAREIDLKEIENSFEAVTSEITALCG